MLCRPGYLRCTTGSRSVDIPHYVVNYEAAFMDDVITAFADSYMAGETPVPCVLCNQTVKFRDLVKAARDLGACPW